MADNVPITAGSGTNIATDDVGGAHYQKIKLALGAEDAVDLVVDSGQQTSANSVPVVIASDQSAVPVSATNLDVRDLAQTQDNVKVGDGTSFIDIDVAPTDGETNGGKRLLHTEAWLWLYNGTSWDRVRGDTTNGLDVDVTRVSGNVTVVQGTAANLKVDASGATVPVSGTFWQTTQPVSIASAVPVTDNSGSLTVDNSGTFAVQATLAAETTKVIGTVNLATQVTTWKCVQSTTATTTTVWQPGSGKKVALTYLMIQAGGTTAGNVQVWFGASGDTTYGRGTDAAVFDGEFAPSATLKPGYAVSFPHPIISPTADYYLKVTASAAINPLTVTAWGFEI